MKDGFTDEERANAYKLLMQTYLFSEQIEEADKVMIEFLAEFPAYAIASNDPKEFINLYNTYRTEPIFKIEVLLGARFCFPYVKENNDVSDITLNQPEYKSKFGFATEVNYIGTINEHFSFSAGASFTYLDLEYTNTPNDRVTISGNLSNMYVGLPLGVRYNYSMGIIDLFAKAGIEPVYLLQSKANLERDEPNYGDPIPYSVDYMKEHKKMDVRPFLGIGLEFNLGRDQLIISAGYKASSFYQLKKNEIFPDLSPGNPIERVEYIEDNMLLNQATVSVSYIRPIYKPKKIN
ncbi:MAG: outer membrane beta-barrel protein [Bacteroidales bacterium]|jgi:hypothetical protein|nr:outer membrane beta-barrel protein [Bacteroidales bacterium]